MSSPAAIHVWWTDLDRALPRDWPGIVSRDEIAIANARRRPRDRHRALATRYFVRGVLARHLGRDAAALAFAREPGGKPMLACTGAGVEFSLSHSGATAVLAVAARPVGVDVERLDPLLPLRALAERHMPRAAWTELRGLPEDALGPAFLRFWVRHEAASKVFGAGLDAPRSGAPFIVDDLPAPPDHLAAVAAAGGEPIAIVACSWSAELGDTA